MEIIFERRFLKDLSKIKNKSILKALQTKVEEIEKACELAQVKISIDIFLETPFFPYWQSEPSIIQS